MQATYDLAKAIEQRDSAGYRKIASLMSLDSVHKAVDSVGDLLSALREHLNTFNRVHRLPPELLSLIFEMVTHIPHRHEGIFDLVNVAHEEHKRAPLPSSGVLTITHVCKRWRTVALRMPTLWTYVSALPGSDQFRAYMERSLSLPVSVSVGTDAPHLQESLSSVGPRLRRLDLAINGPEEDSEDIHTFVLRIEAPSVRCATLVCSPECTSDVFEVVVSLEVEWVELFGQRKSSLEALALSLATNWLPSNTFTQLTHLLLSCNPDILSTSRTGLLHAAGQRTAPGVPPHPTPLVQRKRWHACGSGPSAVPATPVAVLNAPPMEVAPLSPPLDSSSPVTSLAIYSKGSTLQINAKSALRDYLLHWESDRDDLYELDDIACSLHNLLSLSTVTSLTLSLGDVDVVPMLQHLHQVSDLELHSSGSPHGPATVQEVLHSIESDGWLPALSSFTLRVHPAITYEQSILGAAAQMLSTRTHMDPRLPVRRVVVQLCDPARDSAARVAWIDYVQANLAPYVEEFGMREISRPRGQHMQWKVEGAEKYWTLYDRAKPEYLGPYGGDSSGCWTHSGLSCE
ncbi:hypothetical protein K466DRAFT_664779 [Polyporus arcularius HHB13444]|uniref:Uncharacterized protein n=1 Tax=Polyporus arcularius HHB13444 TaxID=1314778 RepID=A0A5C3P5U9_9APHY|nr:hypothetical protein K466DRAFT_664779 [Polyporus arcularius HHB13444]